MPKVKAGKFGLHPLLEDSIIRVNQDMAAQGLGTVRVSSGHRTEAEQRKLYQEQPETTAPVGQSVHQLNPSPAVDIDGTPQQLKWIRDNSQRYGLLPSSEPWHFSVKPEMVGA